MKISPYVYVGLSPRQQAIQKRKFLRRLDPEIVLETISEVYNITVDEIRSKIRTRHIADARQLYCFVLRDRYGISHSKIGEGVNRDRTTALHSIKTHQDRYGFVKEYKKLTDEVNCKLELLESQIPSS